MAEETKPKAEKAEKADWIEYEVFAAQEVGPNIEAFETGGGRLITADKKVCEVIPAKGTAKARVRVQRGKFTLE